MISEPSAHKEIEHYRIDLGALLYYHSVTTTKIRTTTGEYFLTYVDLLFGMADVDADEAGFAAGVNGVEGFLK